MSAGVVSRRAYEGTAVMPQEAADEEWVTTKKVEIVTTKNVERKIQRQVVLEDGRVVEEEIPTVTIDTTEDKQTFETDQDEERNLEGRRLSQNASKFDTSGGVLVGDKFTRVKKINDVRENLVKTEAMHNLGDIASKDVKKVIVKGDNIHKYLRKKDKHDQQVIVAPRVVKSKGSHRVVTDQEEVQERNWINKGKMQNERIRTEEHIEYDSDDEPEDGSSSSSYKSSHHQLEPEVYKTRKDENFTEYYKNRRDINNKMKVIKVGDGPHYVSESKEVQREDDPQLSFRGKVSRHPLAEVNRRPVNHTDSWLEKHFGSTSSLSISSAEFSRPGSREGYGLRRSASICDIRPVDNSSNVYYATVRKSGKIADVKVRDRQDRNYYTSNRASANFSSSGHPVRPPRRTKTSGYDVGAHYASSKVTSDYRSSPSEKYYFGSTAPIKHGNGQLNRSFSSVQNLNRKSFQSQSLQHQSSNNWSPAKPSHHRSSGNLYKSPRDEYRHENSLPRRRVEDRGQRRNKAHSETGNTHREQYNHKNYSEKNQRIPVPNNEDDYFLSRRDGKKDNRRHRDELNTARQRMKEKVESPPTPHRIIYNMDAPKGSPSIKYRTRIVINGDGM